jgi:hypothetical protein
MKTPKEFFASLPEYHPEESDECIAMLEARDREVRAAALREAVEVMAMANDGTQNPFVVLMRLANSAEHGEINRLGER